MRTQSATAGPRAVRLVVLAGAALVAACGDGTTDLPGLLVGRWGGEGFALVVTSDSAAARFDCAYGTFGTPVLLSPAGAFSADGSYVQEIGPAALGNPARYEGAVDGERLTLRVVVTDTIFGMGTDTVGPFRGTRGGPASAVYCQ